MKPWRFQAEFYDDALNQTALYHEAGKITRSLGLVYEAYLPGASIGSICKILTGSDPRSTQGVEAEVVGFKDKKVTLMPFEPVTGINNDSLVILVKKTSSIPVGHELLGRVLDGKGFPLDKKGPLFSKTSNSEERSLYAAPTHPLEREMIREPLDLGIKSLNGLLTCGKGQRIGIMSGTGVGKSVLLGMIAKHTKADVNVIALIGERGREVREFLEIELGTQALEKSVVVVSTSDKSPILRMRGAFLATAVAEYFRDEGKDVLLLMDSATRFCMAQREIGLSQGEPPTSRGYTPSVLSGLPRLLERAGMAPKKGSITGIYSVLVEGDELDEPISDAMRAILDGHIVLSRKISQRNHYPAIDVLQSTSRVMKSIVSPEHLHWANQLREWIALYAQVEDLVNVGAYARGTSPKMDVAIAQNDRIQEFLRQRPQQSFTIHQTLEEIKGIIASGHAAAAGAGTVTRTAANAGTNPLR